MLWLLLAGCGVPGDSAGGAMTCVPGRSEACVCSDGASGAQRCDDDGRWEECVCETSPPSSTHTSTNADTGPPEDTASTLDTGAAGDTGASVAPAPLQVYLLGGQSNMDGGGLVTGLPPSLQIAQEDAQIYWSGRGAWQGLSPSSYWTAYGDEYFGPEVTFGRAMQDARPEVALIKHAVGGTDLAYCWDAGAFTADTAQGECYAGFWATVSAALLALEAAGVDHEIAGMAWMQGESDAITESYALDYEDNLTVFIDRVRQDVETPDMPLALGLIDCRAHCPYRDTVRAAQQAVADADPLVYAVETEDLPQNADALHFDASGMRTLGERLAAALLGETQPETAQPAFALTGSSRSDYTGDFVVGYTFSTDRALTVTDLGTLDQDGDGLSDDSTVALWDLQTQGVLARARVPSATSAGSSFWGGWRFAAIEPLTLAPGTYVLGSQVYSGSADRYLHDAQVTIAEGITWDEARHASGSMLDFPTNVYTGEASWFGPNFLFVER